MMLKRQHPLYNFIMSRMRRSYNSKKENLQKLILNRLHQTSTNKRYVNLLIPKISSHKVASLVPSKRELLTHLRKTGGTIARTSWTEERTSSTKEKAGGTEEKTSDTKVITNMRGRGKILHLFRVHRTGGAEERSGCKKAKLPSQEVDSLVRVRRDLSLLSQRGTDEGTGGTDEGIGGTKKRTGGTEERNGGTEGRTGSTEDSYKQWRKMG